MNHSLAIASALILVGATLTAPACGGTDEEDRGPEAYTWMEGEVADCEFDIVTFKTADGVLHEVSVNGLPVEELVGANKVSATEWETTERRGVRVSRLLTRGELGAGDATPVNCVARDGWDPLRTQLSGDTSRLPRFDFVRDHGYVYVGNPGESDPLYPDMEGKSLLVDYDVGADTDVPAYLGATLAGLGKFRWKMVEKVDEQQRGIIEIDPVP